ncbi:MAG: DUF2298 domain-containing protein [Anaerolineales bacterium]
MISLLLWYLLLTLLGWLTFPLVFRLFPALADRGFALARTAGLLVWGYSFWLLASLGVAQNDSGGILLALVILIGLSTWSFINHKLEIVDFLKKNVPLILTVEVLFLVAFGFMALVRSANPELTSTEKPMELAFISGIMRSPTFPPQDPWLSGYAISYYYFGYVMTAMLAKLTHVPASMAHNMMTSLIFSLGALGAYGILYTLLGKAKTSKTELQSVVRASWSTVTSSLLAPLFLLFVSNFEALLEVLHGLGLFWKRDSNGQFVSAFWQWLDIKDLSSAPVGTFTLVPSRYYWWWRASRVLQDYDMRHNPLEVIDEFPSFSFLLGDLHPHVLAIPFSLLAIAVALNIFLGGWKGEINLFGARLYIKMEGFFFSALVLGGLAFLNTWDILIGASLIVGAYVFTQAHEDGWNWSRLEDLFLLGLPLELVSIFMYLPFYLGFSSQAGGILPSLMYPSRGAQLWVMWGTLLIPIYACLLYLWKGARLPINWKTGLILGLGFALLLWVFSWFVGWVGSFIEKDFVASFLAAQGMDASTFFRAASLRRLSYIGGLITMLAVLIPALSFLFFSSKNEMVEDEQTTHGQLTSIHFVLLIIVLGSILIIAPDFVYLRDQFGYRINTIFKFYYQAWILWSLAASFGVAYLIQNISSKGWSISFRVGMGLVIFAGLLYPALSIPTKTNNFNPVGGFTLDDFDRVKRENPDEAAGIEWLRNAPDGVVVEAVGGSYDASFARVATYTGLQNVLGWPGHESQWRGGMAPQGTRQADIQTLYSIPDWDTANSILKKYNIRYVFIGNTERVTLPVSEEKFASHLKQVFQQGIVSIYEVP